MMPTTDTKSTIFSGDTTSEAGVTVENIPPL